MKKFLIGFLVPSNSGDYYLEIVQEGADCNDAIEKYIDFFNRKKNSDEYELRYYHMLFSREIVEINGKRYMEFD